jgi:hypothetical protein
MSPKARGFGPIVAPAAIGTFSLRPSLQSAFLTISPVDLILGDCSLVDAHPPLSTASGCVLTGRRQRPVLRCWDGRSRPRREARRDRTVQVFALGSRLSFDRHPTCHHRDVTRERIGVSIYGKVGGATGFGESFAKSDGGSSVV